MNSDASAPQKAMYPCHKCYFCYEDYKHLLEHLYWRHGTESRYCNRCTLKRWAFADHVCYVLPIYEDFTSEPEVENDVKVRESQYCYCGKNIDIPMIGCDAPQCALQWYHFKCVGIAIPPPGDWFCPECTKSVKKKSFGKT